MVEFEICNIKKIILFINIKLSWSVDKYKNICICIIVIIMFLIFLVINDNLNKILLTMIP